MRVYPKETLRKLELSPETEGRVEYTWKGGNIPDRRNCKYPVVGRTEK